MGLRQLKYILWYISYSFLLLEWGTRKTRGTKETKED
jgi:hypothetical protein